MAGRFAPFWLFRPCAGDRGGTMTVSAVSKSRASTYPSPLQGQEIKHPLSIAIVKTTERPSRTCDQSANTTEGSSPTKPQLQLNSLTTSRRCAPTNTIVLAVLWRMAVQRKSQAERVPETPYHTRPNQTHNPTDRPPPVGSCQLSVSIYLYVI